MSDQELLLRALVSQHTTAGLVDGYAVAQGAFRMGQSAGLKEGRAELLAKALEWIAKLGCFHCAPIAREALNLCRGGEGD